tara:strand:- start:1248 stop:1370 length:123 start_codon:yes stop_codon:yes gene_type:complete
MKDKTVIVRRCGVCNKVKPVWSNLNGIFCKGCYKKGDEEE